MKKVTFAFVAGMLGIAFAAAAPAVEARGLPTPPEVVRDVHQLARDHIRRAGSFVDHAVGFHEGYRHEDLQRYPGRVYDRRDDRSSRRYPVVVRGSNLEYPYYGGGYINGYVDFPSVGISVGVRPGRPDYRRDDCDRNRYRDDDRRRYDEEDHD